MTYVSGFKHDIFLSYASVNNPKPEEWVTEFRVNLEKTLACRIGKGINIWMDKKDIAVGNDFENEITESIEASAILLIILSDGYLDSKWCTIERDIFLEKINKLKRSDIDGFPGSDRIFVVRMEDVNRDDFPEELKGIHWIDFFIKDENNKVRTYGWPKLLESDPNYYGYFSKITNLSMDLAKSLKKLKTLRDKTSNSGTREIKTTTSKNRHLYEKMMRECHGLIVIYGESDENWVTLVLEKSVTVQRDKPLEAGAIIKGPPPVNDEEERWLPFMPRFMRKIDCTNRFNKKELESFFSEVNKSFNKSDPSDTSTNFGAIVFVNAIGKDRELAKKICKMASENYDMTYYSPINDTNSC